MNQEKQHITLKQIELALDNKVLLRQLIDRLKVEDIDDEEVVVIKDFLEKHDYDADALIEFFKPNVADFEKILEKHTAKKRNSILRVAAVFVPLIGIGFFWISNRTTATDVAFKKYYETELGIPVTMGSSGNVQFLEAMNTYRDGDFTAAISQFESLQAGAVATDSLNYFVGCCYFNLEDFDKAISKLEAVDESSFYYQKARFYMALAYIQQNQLPKAKSTLRLISASYPKAKQLLDEAIFDGI